MAVKISLPSISRMKRTIQRSRNQVSAPLLTPSNLYNLTTPEQYKVIVYSEPFLMFDSGPGNDSILIFTTSRNLEALSRCDHWFFDGTFKSAPPLFAQVYSTHGIRFHAVLPMVYALVIKKQQQTYARVIVALKGLQPGLNPVSVMSDFEKAQISTFQVEFPEIDNSGCLFHFCQCIWCAIQPNEGYNLVA